MHFEKNVHVCSIIKILNNYWGSQNGGYSSVLFTWIKYCNHQSKLFSIWSRDRLNDLTNI